MKKIIILIAVFTFALNLFAQTDATSESKNGQNSFRNAPLNEAGNNSVIESPRVPAALLKSYDDAVDNKNGELKSSLSTEIEKHLRKAEFTGEPIDVNISNELNPPFMNDWYGSDIQVSNTDVANFGGYRQLDLKKGEDGWMYLAINRRNVGGLNGCITVYRSSNGGADWALVANITSITGYFGSISMLVESRLNSVADSTRILVYATLSAASNQNGAYLILSSFRRDGSAPNYFNVANPSAGNRFTYPSACSDGAFWEGVTFMHAVVREETNAGAFVNLHHYRTTSWGLIHTVGSWNFNTFDERYPAAAFSIKTGTDSVYIAVERVINNDEHEIRLFATSDTPQDIWSLRYITDAPANTLYERPAITIQQRSPSLPQRILVTCSKNQRAVYHFSTDGGALWNIDYGLGLGSMPVDYTTCSSDTLASGGKDFISTFVDLNGDSVTVRHGELGSLGTPMYKKNSLSSTSTLAPVCAIYREGSTKYSAFSYAGVGPTGVYYNMENLITGITPVNGNIPQSFSLSQNYPNPFNPVTNIMFSVAKTGLVTLKVYDITGTEVAKLVNEELAAGTYNFDFNASQLASGIYFYKMTSGNFTGTKKMVLVK